MRSRLINSVLLPSRIFALAVLLVLQTLPIATHAQQEARIFVLPVASISNLYQINIEQILRENYGLKLLRTAETQSFRWYLHSGALPLGLRIMPNGNIVGRPRSARPEPYKFKVKVLDGTAASDELVLMLELKVEPSRIQLVSTNAPRLVPLSEESAAPNDNTGARISLSDRVAPIWNGNHFKTGKGSDAPVARATDNSRDSIIALRERDSAAARETRPQETRTENASFARSPSSSATEVSAAAAAADPSCPSCLPDPKPDDKKDFIIDVRTRETSGKKKFRLNDNARIIVKEMNPFLYEYRVTLKDKPIVESAIATFFSGWPLFADQFENPEDKADSKAKMAASESVACDQLDRQYGTAVGRIRQLIAELSSAAAQIGRDYTRQKEAYEPVAQKIETDKKVLYDENANCSDVCRTATSIRSTLQQYKPDLEDLSKRISNFKLDADLLQRRVEELKELIENNPRPNPNLPPVTGPQCDEVISGFEVLAKGYVTTASGLESGIKKITSGKKMFDAIVKTINDVLSNPNAFYKVYTRGEYSLPTDVEITVERKDLTKENATFVKIVDAETINFGGGPRFAVAGGVVVSPLETINFKRVPALINGQQTTIVGQDESSNSRILPILMLHGRFLEGKGPISGFHFSLGVTAKPTDSGTNVEFLLGPSISFIEERLFFTFGGYAGRRKQLEGNLVPGQELPKDFSDEIPTSNHLVWKPGIALTYKFK